MKITVNSLHFVILGRSLPQEKNPFKISAEESSIEISGSQGDEYKDDYLPDSGRNKFLRNTGH